ncbi:hypothetical protein [Alkalibacillus haloalkaliphilus]|uniref:hypothetical protein n=1 Tax=Alkalibacillus haloalkaliphilus TaxID=94136 RepID=UPI000313EB5B|nr:hypothetical protein [Alkalibacillus haloalkaliphilus]
MYIFRYTHESDFEFEIIYKGPKEDVQSIEKLEFSYGAGAKGGSRSVEFDEPPKDSTFTISGGGTGAQIQEEAVIQVEVKWNDFEESFELVNQEE